MNPIYLLSFPKLKFTENLSRYKNTNSQLCLTCNITLNFLGTILQSRQNVRKFCSFIFIFGGSSKDGFILTERENNNHQYGCSNFCLLVLYSSFSSSKYHLHGPGDVEYGYCCRVIASFSYWSWSFKGKIKEVFVIYLHRPDMKFSEAFRINTILCVCVYVCACACVHVCLFFCVILLWCLYFGLKCLVSDLLESLAKDNCFQSEG